MKKLKKTDEKSVKNLKIEKRIEKSVKRLKDLLVKNFKKV
ncbi:hypothetical protein HMPREF1419_00263 [Helicobacter pylori GAM263BFi]|nr:hypothetical protein HMPREF1419_00263 [Helicobacter pylori GAM263BFi]